MLARARLRAKPGTIAPFQAGSVWHSGLLGGKPGTIAPFEAGSGTAAFLVEAADPAQLLPVKL